MPGSAGLSNNVGDPHVINNDCERNDLKSPSGGGGGMNPTNETSVTNLTTLEGKTIEEKLAFYMQREKLLVQKLSQNEENFGQKRAKFMEMYMQVNERFSLRTYTKTCP